MSGPWEKYQAAQTSDAGPWAKYAEPKKEEKSLVDSVKEGAANFAKGVASGFADVGDTILNVVGNLAEGNLPKVELEKMRMKGAPQENYSNEARSASLKQFNDANKDSNAFSVGRVAGNVAATYPVGGVLASGARAVSSAPLVNAFANALESGGLRTGFNLAEDATWLAKAGEMGIRSAGGAITGGVSAAAINPEQAETGAVVGGLLPPAMAAMSKAGNVVRGVTARSNQGNDLAKKAIEEYGIPLGIADVSPNGTVKALRSVLNDAPLSASVGASQREAVQAGFNKAVGGTFGAPEAKLTPDVLDAAKKRMGAEFDRLWNQNSLNVDGEMVGKLMSLRERAAKLPKNEGASLNAEVDDIFSKMVQGEDGALTIPGDTANRFQSYLRRRAEGSAGLKNELTDLRQSIISAFNRGIGEADAAALTQNRGQYKAFKTIEPLLNSAEAGVAGRIPGDVPAGLLPQAVARQYSQAGGTPLGELAQIGSRFIVDRTPRTGGSMRATLQNLGVGGALVGAGAVSPALAVAALPAAVGVNALLGSPALARRVVNNQGGNRLAEVLRMAEMERLGYRAAPVVISDY